MIVLELYQLKSICMEMAELGAANYVRQTTPAADKISQREAYRLFGEARVKRLKREGVIHPEREGSTSRSTVMYSRAELLSLEKAEKLNSLINK